MLLARIRNHIRGAGASSLVSSAAKRVVDNGGDNIEKKSLIHFLLFFCIGDAHKQVQFFDEIHTLIGKRGGASASALGSF